MASMCPESLAGEWLFQMTTQALTTRDNTLDAEDFYRTGKEIIGFAIVLVLHCQPEIASRVLEKLFKVPGFSVQQDEQMVLELIWQSFPGRPENTPWAAWDATRLNEATKIFDPNSLDFYTIWTDTDWFEHRVGTTIGNDYDAHQWKGSQDPWTHAICARVLCQPKEEKLPSREKLEEAFEAVDKIFTQLPPIENMPLNQIFPPKIYFIMAVHLGYFEKAHEILLRMASQNNGSELYAFVDVPSVYEVLKDPTSADSPPVNIVSLDKLEEALNILLAALDNRIEHGWRKPLSDLSVAELLSRFTKAAFFVHRDEYLKNNINSPDDILYMPITAERIAELETKLGPLPEDVKEIALIGDGFCGGWHFTGGGWPGIEKLYKTSASNYKIYLGFDSEPETRVETRTRPDGTTESVIVNIHSIGVEGEERGWGDVLVGTPAKECDDFEHVLCPPSVWAKYHTSKGTHVKDGEYAYLHFAHWTDGGEIYSSVKEWIAAMTVGLERQVAVGERESLEDESE